MFASCIQRVVHVYVPHYIIVAIKEHVTALTTFLVPLMDQGGRCPTIVNSAGLGMTNVAPFRSLTWQ